MKTIYLKGGLGNQMFQYAYGRNLELAGEKVIFNTSFFNGAKPRIDSARDYKLDNYNIKTQAKFSNKKNIFLNLINRIKNRLNPKDSDYYQSEKYFKQIEDMIRNEFTLKNSLAENNLTWQKVITQAENSVSLHVRRGDYVQNAKTNAYHGTCDMEYYKRALGKVAQILNKQNIEIFVFSDDIEWARNNLKFPYQTYFVSNPSTLDYEEMYLMSLCKHNIIANSTFSWWGAWLNQNPNKIIIGPRQWFSDKTSDELDILPKVWIQI